MSKSLACTWTSLEWNWPHLHRSKPNTLASLLKDLTRRIITDISWCCCNCFRKKIETRPYANTNVARALRHAFLFKGLQLHYSLKRRKHKFMKRTLHVRHHFCKYSLSIARTRKFEVVTIGLSNLTSCTRSQGRTEVRWRPHVRKRSSGSKCIEKNTCDTVEYFRPSPGHRAPFPPRYAPAQAITIFWSWNRSFIKWIQSAYLKLNQIKTLASEPLADFSKIFLRGRRVEFVFSHSKVRKQPFLAEIFKIKGWPLANALYFRRPRVHAGVESSDASGKTVKPGLYVDVLGRDIPEGWYWRRVWGHGAWCCFPSTRWNTVSGTARWSPEVSAHQAQMGVSTVTPAASGGMTVYFFASACCLLFSNCLRWIFST